MRAAAERIVPVTLELVRGCPGCPGYVAAPAAPLWPSCFWIVSTGLPAACAGCLCPCRAPARRHQQPQQQPAVAVAHKPRRPRPPARPCPPLPAPLNPCPPSPLPAGRQVAPDCGQECGCGQGCGRLPLCAVLQPRPVLRRWLAHVSGGGRCCGPRALGIAHPWGVSCAARGAVQRPQHSLALAGRPSARRLCLLPSLNRLPRCPACLCPGLPPAAQLRPCPPTNPPSLPLPPGPPPPRAATCTPTFTTSSAPRRRPAPRSAWWGTPLPRAWSRGRRSMRVSGAVVGGLRGMV